MIDGDKEELRVIIKAGVLSALAVLAVAYFVYFGPVRRCVSTEWNQGKVTNYAAVCSAPAGSDTNLIWVKFPTPPRDLSPEMDGDELVAMGSSNLKCVWCGETLNLNWHHIYMQSKYPQFKHEKWNLVCLCRECHFVIGHKRNWRNEFTNLVAVLKDGQVGR